MTIVIQSEEQIMAVETQQRTSVTGASSEARTYKDAPTQTINAAGVKFAYRQLGPDTGVPVVFLTHLAAVLDNWDPRVVDGIAARHRVIIFNNRGVGASSGSTPTTVEEMARDAVRFIRALGFDQLDLFGFSLGGMIAQVIAQEEPRLVRKMILAGTGPAGGDGIDKVTRISYLDTARGLLTRRDPRSSSSHRALLPSAGCSATASDRSRDENSSSWAVQAIVRPLPTPH
jgi:pimeloyl-ACP methyl ester carboxylesterase